MLIHASILHAQELQGLEWEEMIGGETAEDGEEQQRGAFIVIE